MDLAPGLHVSDNVRLVSVLGEGGMGSVWVADHLSLHTRVAVKFLSAELMRDDPGMLQRFEREAALSAQIKSPHVVQTFDHGVMADGRPFIVMELLDGESLAERLQRTRILHVQETVEVVSQTAKALNKAHKVGVVHRDIKPDNLFLSIDDGEMHLKVLDFGIAKQTGLPKASSVTGTGVMVGTPEYMSPEQVLSARSVDARSDLWALAVVAYHCLTGGVPFTGETLGSLCVAIANGAFTPPTKYRPELPAAIDTWFLKALAKEASERFASAKELAMSFAHALSPGMPINAEAFSISGGPMTPPDWSGVHPQVIGGFTPPATPSPAGGMSAPMDVAARSGAYPDSLESTALSPGQIPGLGPPGSPTFAGATMTQPPPRGRRVAAAVIVSTVLLGVAGVGLFAMLGRAHETEPIPAAADAPDESASTEEEPAAGPWGSAKLDEPDEAHVEVATSAASASASASSSASAPEAAPPSKPVAKPKPAAKPRPAPRPSPQPKQKDRGF